MVTLEMVLDPSGIRRGAAEAERALGTVGAAAGRAGQAVDDIGARAGRAARGVGSLSDAFQSVSGSIQVGQGITQTLAALERADVASAGTNVARTLLEIAKTKNDFSQLATGVGATGGVLSTLASIVRAHPLLSLATVVGGIATAFGLMRQEVQQTTKATDDLAAALSAVRADRIAQVRIGLGGADSRATPEATLDTLAKMQAEGTTSFGVTDAANRLGLSEIELRNYLARVPGVGDSATRYRAGQVGFFDLSQFGVEDTIRAGQLAYGDRLSARAFAEYQRRAPQPNLDAIGGTRAPLTQYGPGADDWEQEQERRAAALEEFQQQVQELRQVGAQVGSTFASAFETIINKTNSAREAVEQLIRTLGSQVFQSVFQNLGASIAGGLAGSGPSGRTRSVDAPGWQQA